MGSKQGSGIALSSMFLDKRGKKTGSYRGFHEWHGCSGRRPGIDNGLELDGQTMKRGATYPGTISILSFRPKARAALPKMVRVTEVFESSSSRSTAARLVFIRAAISVFEIAFCAINLPNCSAKACFRARASTSSKIPSSWRKLRKFVPRCGFLFIAF